MRNQTLDPLDVAALKHLARCEVVARKPLLSEMATIISRSRTQTHYRLSKLKQAGYLEWPGKATMRITEVGVKALFYAQYEIIWGLKDD